VVKNSLPRPHRLCRGTAPGYRSSKGILRVAAIAGKGIVHRTRIGRGGGPYRAIAEVDGLQWRRQALDSSFPPACFFVPQFGQLSSWTALVTRAVSLVVSLGGRHMLRSHLLAATAALIMSATAAMADNKSDCQKGIAMIKAELKKKHPEPVLATLRKALSDAETEVIEADWSECMDLIKSARKALGK
jgi:hypothetical protein